MAPSETTYVQTSPPELSTESSGRGASCAIADATGFQRVRRQKLQLLWLRPAIRPGGKELKAQRKELKPKRKETKARHKEMKPKRKETKI